MGGFGVTASAQLVYFITAPAYPHATWVAVYPALLFAKITLEGFSKKITSLAVARERIHLRQPLATAKRATFLQTIGLL